MWSGLLGQQWEPGFGLNRPGSACIKKQDVLMGHMSRDMEWDWSTCFIWSVHPKCISYVKVYPKCKPFLIHASGWDAGCFGGRASMSKPQMLLKTFVFLFWILLLKTLEPVNSYSILITSQPLCYCLLKFHNYVNNLISLSIQRHPLYITTFYGKRCFTW